MCNIITCSHCGLWELHNEISAHVTRCSSHDTTAFIACCCVVLVGSNWSAALLIMHCTRCSPVSQRIKHTTTLRTAAVPPPLAHTHTLFHCMLIFISALTAGAVEEPPRLDAGLISQVGLY